MQPYFEFLSGPKTKPDGLNVSMMELFVEMSRWSAQTYRKLLQKLTELLQKTDFCMTILCYNC